MNFDQFKYLGFDCYGTLIDWETGISSSLNGIFYAHDVTTPQNVMLGLFGKVEAEIKSGPNRPYREVLKAVLVKIGDELDFQPSPDEFDSFSTSVGI